MSVDKRKNIIKITEDMIRILALFMLAVVFMMMMIAAFDKNNISGEPPIGTYEAFDFNEGWLLSSDKPDEEITLPFSPDESYGNQLDITNVLPDNITEGMTLLTRTSLSNMYIYIGGELRAKYTSDMLNGKPKYNPSGYIAINLNSGDAGKTIRIKVELKAHRALDGVTYGYGLNPWKDTIKYGAMVNIAASFVLMLGGMLVVGCLFLGRSYRVDASRNLGLLMINIGMWIISETKIRQVVFCRPSLARFFAYFAVELIVVFGCMFFDEVQHRNYHKRYLVMEGVQLLQLFINIILNAFGVAEMYDTLVFSHIWMVVGILMSIVNIVTDVKTGKSGEYRITLIGMICFLIMSSGELIGFYTSQFHQMGTWISIGLIILMITTIMQVMHDERIASEKRERRHTASMINTIEIIANSIDASDEYTGGHSERVGYYAMRLAREMAADYDLSEDDILRVHYIGLVHDIGKIGVAESVLNKAGKLNDEEFSLMKKHPEIGYEIMSSMGNEIEGLLEGIRNHHERFDGNGYPDGLSDTDIPLVARILALADSYDAMTSNRIYRKRLTDEEVLAELRRCSGTQFDPALTNIFIDLIERGEMKVGTIEGLSTDKNGNIRKSAVLEAKLQADIHEGVDVLNPNHIRMLCYIIKLMENKEKSYDIFFIDRFDNDHANEELDKVIKSFIGNHDVNIRYTKDISLVALYDKRPAAIDMFMTEIIKVRGDEKWIRAL